MQTTQVTRQEPLLQERLLGVLHIPESGGSVSLYDTSKSFREPSFRISLTEGLSASVIVNEAERLFKAKHPEAERFLLDPKTREEMLSQESVQTSLPKDFFLTLPFKTLGKDLYRQQEFLKREGMAPASLGQIIAFGVLSQVLDQSPAGPFCGYYVRSVEGATPWNLSWKTDCGITASENVRHSRTDSGFVMMAGVRPSDAPERDHPKKTWADSLRTGFRI